MKGFINVFAWTLWVMLLAACSDSADRSETKPLAMPSADQALTDLTHKAESGDPQSQFELGRRYFNGEGVQKDPAKAVEWFRRSAEQGNAKSKGWLGILYVQGVHLPREAVKGLELLRQSADEGDARAQGFLGLLYQVGAEVPLDLAKAVDWTRKAAEQGDSLAQAQIGDMYERGIGVPKDLTAAAEWYRKSAEQGHPWGQTALGVRYELGEGVPKDAEKALEWYRKAAEYGDKDGQWNLARMYWLGIGVARDMVRAYLWANLSAAQGRGEAARLRDEMEQQMTPEQVAEAQRMARAWKPGQPDGASPRSLGTPNGNAASKVGTGTAFVVSKAGHLLTNRHVVASCNQIRLAGSATPLKLLPQDAVNDLALLQMADKPPAVATFRRANELRQGEAIVVYGYPLEGALAAGGNLSTGVISALAGLGNNTSQFQITAPVQSGNSGGPVLDGKGQVIGVVVQKLDAIKVARLTGDVPQNVNFAINVSTARAFLDGHQVPYQTGRWWQFWEKNLEETATDARKYTFVVECWK